MNFATLFAAEQAVKAQGHVRVHYMPEFVRNPSLFVPEGKAARRMKAITQQIVQEYFETHPGATGRMCAKAKGIAEATVSNHAKRLAEAGILIRKEGHTKKGRPCVFYSGK